MTFTKLQGIGNDFVVVDALREVSLPEDLPAFARKVSDRRFGIGGDGLILAERGDVAPFRMRMFNPDGSESEMCGNGLRCVARLLRDHEHVTTESVSIETGAGVLVAEFVAQNIRIDMGPARLTRGEIGMTGPADETFIDQAIGEGFRGTAVSMGNPHIVIFVPDVQAIELDRVGPILERSPLFPQRTNVHFVQVVDRSTLIQRTWERGAGITLACGTGACSVGVAAFLNGHSERKVLIHLPGGNLEVEYLETGHVLMTGPAETVFTGELSL